MRIPCTVDEKHVLVVAAQANGERFAAWARRVLLRAAKKALGGAK